MTWDEMKLARDGHLSPTKVEPEKARGVRRIFKLVARLPNGNVITTDGGCGHLEWGPA